MGTDRYLALFYPFDQLDLVKREIESAWKVSEDRTMVALTMTFMDEPMAKTMSFQRQYAEPYDWVAQQFKDWAFTLTTSILYYQDYRLMDQDTRELYQKAMAAFGGIAPSYHIELLDKPTIYWDFHSLLLGIQMMFRLHAGGRGTPFEAMQELPESIPGQTRQQPPFAVSSARTSTTSQE